MNQVQQKKVKIALVGCGRISSNHLRAISQNGDRAELVALCDTEDTRLDACLKEWSEFRSCDSSSAPKRFNRYDDLISEALSKQIQIDLVVLTTPSGLHPSQAIAAAKAGIHVCTEKPMATRWKDALRMVEECDNNDVKLFVVKQNRFNSTLQLLKRQVEAQRFGEIALVAVNVFWHRPQSYYDSDSWRGTWRLDGGALMNQASHYVDLLTWLIGLPETVSASMTTRARDIEAEDTIVLQLKWRGGELGTMSVTMLTYPENMEGSITILGTKGSIKVGGKAVNTIDKWVFADDSEDDKLIAEASYRTTSVYGLGHTPYYVNMLDVLDGKSKPTCDGKEGLKSLEVIVAAYQSAKRERPVKLPLPRD